MTALEIITKNYEDAKAKLADAVDRQLSYSTYRKRLKVVNELYWAKQRIESLEEQN